jgi:Hypoxia induced protein conserved region
MDRLFQFLIPLSLITVAVVLAIGIYALFRGGDFGRSYSNKLMRLRVVAQAIAIAVLMASVWWSQRG